MRVLTVLPDALSVEACTLESLPMGGALCADSTWSWDSLVDRLIGGVERRPVGTSAQQALLGSCASAADLRQFGLLHATPSFLRGVEEVVESLCEAEVAPEVFRSAVEELPSAARSRAQVLAELNLAYRRALAERGALPAFLRVPEATLQVRSGRRLPQELRAYDELRVERRGGLTEAEVSLLVSLAQRAAEGQGPRVVVRLPWSSDPAVDRALECTFRAIEEKGRDLPALEVQTFEPAEGSGVGATLARRLAGRIEPPPEIGRVSVFEGANPEAEAREVARRIRRRVDEGAQLDAIAVVSRTASLLVSRARDYLESYGVPTVAPVEPPLRDAPPFQAISELIQVVLSEFPRERFAGLLQSRYFRLAEPNALRGVARLLREAGVRDNRSGSEYARRLDALVRRQRHSSDSRARQRSPKTLAQMTILLEVMGRLRSLPEVATMAEHCGALNQLLESAAFRQECEAFGVAAEAEGRTLAAVARDQACATAISELLTGLPMVHAWAGRSHEQFHLRQFVQVLGEAAQTRSGRRPGSRPIGVRFLDPQSAAGQRFEHLFVVGLNDGDFPARREPSTIFPEEDRLRINGILGRSAFPLPATREAGWELGTQSVEESLLFYLSLCSATHRIDLSYSRQGMDGREALRSSFVDVIERLGGVAHEVVPLSPIGRRRAVGAAELRTGVAWECLADPPNLLTSGDAVEAASVEELSRREPERWGEIRRRAEMERERRRAQAGPDAPIGAYSGLASGSDVGVVLQSLFSFPPNRALTAKQLDEYGTCPFKSFAIRGLGLRAAAEATDDADAQTRGTVLHRVLQSFYLRLREEQRLPLRGGEDEQVTLVEETERVLGQVDSDLHVGHPELWKLRREELVERLRLALAAEQRYAVFEGLVPARFEFESRAQPSRPEAEFAPLPLYRADQAAPIYLGGKIDRVDLGGGRAAVVDYKSASASYLRTRLRERLLSSDFQLVTYLALVQGAMGYQAVDAAFVSLRDQEVVRLSEVLAQRGARLAELLELDPGAAPGDRPNFARRVWEMVLAMRAGQFPVRPVDCTYCEFAGVCRVQAASETGGAA